MWLLWPSTHPRIATCSVSSPAGIDSMPITRRRPSLRCSSASTASVVMCPQGDPQHDETPEHVVHRVIIAPLAPGSAERFEQLAVGECGEQILDGCVAKDCLPGSPKRRAACTVAVNDHRRRRTSGWKEQKGDHTHYYATNPRRTKALWGEKS